MLSQMNPDMKLVIAGAILIVALVFFFFGQDLVNAPQEVATPTPTSFLPYSEASRA